jgi:hypothetical protein
MKTSKLLQVGVVVLGLAACFAHANQPATQPAAQKATPSDTLTGLSVRLLPVLRTVHEQRVLLQPDYVPPSPLLRS